MNRLIIDAAGENIFFVLINNKDIYNITHSNSKTNYEKLVMLINKFLYSKDKELKDISTIYTNRGPGSFAGIRNSLSTIKAIHLATNIDYFCFSFNDFKNITNIKYENIPNLCDKFNIKKNLINPIYIS
jgi:tRNA A37 threonylcarbamoyladenosine modification protein TsaB